MVIHLTVNCSIALVEILQAEHFQLKRLNFILFYIYGVFEPFVLTSERYYHILLRAALCLGLLCTLL